MKNKDITCIIKQALAKKQSWNSNLFLDVLERLASAIPGSKIDWDSGVPEKWGSVTFSETLAFISFSCPLIILKEGSFQPKILESIDALFLVTNSLKSKMFKVDQKVLEKLAGKPITTNVNWENCSIQEIWWATVT